MKTRRVAAVTAILVASLGCLEPPVSESLDIRILRGGASVVTVGVVLRKASDFSESPRVQQRIDSETRALEDGSDAWSTRLRAADPALERAVTDRERGRLFRVTRHARFDSPEDLHAFLRDTGVSVAYDEGRDWAELTILPGRPGRPTTAQRERVKSELASWSAKLAAYFAATEALYGYLETHPDRARPCLAQILTKLPEGESLSEGEEKLAKAVEDTMNEAGVVLTAPPDEAYTIDELSRLVYDPFPAPIRVAVPGKIVEREGFPGELEAPLAIPVASFWAAVERLEGRWARPDPMLATWRTDVANHGKEVDLDAFLSVPRQASSPTALEIQRAIEDQLRSPSLYRVRWTPADAAAEPLPFDRAP